MDDQQTQTPLKVKEIRVEGLFGLYEHRIGLKEKGRITIIHGPNGVGKTVLLKSVTAFFNGNYFVLANTPFERLTLTLSDGSQAIIHRLTFDDTHGAAAPLQVTLTSEGARPNEGDNYVIELPDDFARHAAMLARYVPGLEQIGPDVFYESRTDTRLTPEETVWKFASHAAAPPAVRRRVQGIEPDAIKQFRSQIDVRMIETNRLYKAMPPAYGRRTEVELSERITDYASKLREKIQHTLASYGRNAQKLDQTFPHRLISEPIIALNIKSLKAELTNLDDTQRSLAEFGLLERIESIPLKDSESDIEASKIVALTLFASDIKEKLKILNPLAARLNIFLESINGKLRNKSIYITKENGITAKDLRGNPLSLENLSSGEQHEIVLIYDLVFNIPPNALVLVDEPELSLHVTWQKMFLPELMRISEEAQFECLVATHSPFIVGPYADRMVLLDADPDVDLSEDAARDLALDEANYGEKARGKDAAH